MLTSSKIENKCLIHFAGTKESLYPFTKKRFETFLCRREEWLQLDDIVTIIAKNSLHVCCQDESSENYEQYFFHQKCYNLFTDISKLRRARQLKITHNDAEKENWRPCKEVEEPQSPKRKKVKQQRHGRLSVQQGSNSNVLPDVCIICKRKTSYIKDKVCFAKGCYFSQFKTTTSHSAVLDVIIFFVKLLFRELGKLPKTKCTRLKPSPVAVFEKLLKAKMTNRF